MGAGVELDVVVRAAVVLKDVVGAGVVLDEVVGAGDDLGAAVVTEVVGAGVVLDNVEDDVGSGVAIDEIVGSVDANVVTDDVSAVHVPPSAPVKPALHLQLTADVLPPGASELAGHVEHALSPVAPTAPEYFPDPHSRHAPLPAFILYVPSTHAVHVPPSVPV